MSRRYTSKQFQAARDANSEAMRIANPMHNPEAKEKASRRLKEYWTPERRQEQSEARKGVNNISEDGIQRLKELWTGKPKPRKEGQQNKIRQSMSKGTWTTPFGDFYNPTQAALSPQNIHKISRAIIEKSCLRRANGYSFTPKTQK